MEGYRIQRRVVLRVYPNEYGAEYGADTGFTAATNSNGAVVEQCKHPCR